MKIVEWLKKYGWMVLVGITGVLAIILGVEHEKKKIAGLKRDVEIAKVKKDIAVYERDKEVAKEKDVELKKEDEVLDDKIKEDEDAIQDARKKAEKISGSAIADEFNRRYFTKP